MKRLKVPGLLLLAVILAACGSPKFVQEAPPARAFPGEDDVEHRKLVEGYNKLVRVMNEICPQRQDIPQCKAWCERVDCKE